MGSVWGRFGIDSGSIWGQFPYARFLGILFFLQKCKCQSVTLIGFDFFAKKLPVKTGGDYPSSWHMPCNLSKANPHNPKEKDIVKKWEKEGKLKWRILSDLETEMLKFS